MDQEVAAALMPSLHLVNSLHGTAIRELSLCLPGMSGTKRTFTVLLYYLYRVIVLHLLIIVLNLLH